MAQDLDKITQDLQEAILRGYSQKFKDEFLAPKNIGKLEKPDSHVRITGPCGDTIEMWLAIEDGEISDIRFTTDGCGATITCASYVTTAAKGRTIEDALAITPEDVINYFQGLPDEHKHCAKLAVMTLTAAIEKYRSETGE
ncbi:MAG: iron-sulfur cluster assembly scaffold protein [Sedimentisphaerales bacterium]|nr:iron-sulfur cluster assembly scaffold protein [Sedimentisphaerales bacterium]